MGRALAVATLAIACGSPAEPASPPQPQPPAPAPRPPAVRRVEGFKSPRSVLHDPVADVYLVANVHGDPAAYDDDDNGFISRVAPDGTLLARAWIDGAAEGVELSAPMGMALADGLLWVADRDQVRTFDAVTGRPRTSYRIEGAKTLSDVVAVDGAVIVSDHGPDSMPGGLYRIAHGRVAPLLDPGQPDIGHPHGLHAARDGSLWVTADRQLYQVVNHTRTLHDELPLEDLDGIVGLPSGELLVASHEGTILRGTPAPGLHGRRAAMGVAWTAAFADLRTPGDIGLDAGRRRLLIPLVLADAIEIRDLPDR